ncbi:hypothetical protein EV714DRAFT_273772 [Schizophyllum commune]
MPEVPEVNVWLIRLLKCLLKLHKKKKQWPKGVLQIFPITFALGTRRKPYTTVPSVDNAEYQSSSALEKELALRPEDMSSKFTASRSKNQLWEYLLRRMEPGAVYAARRNKQLAIAAGHHCLVIRFGLEGHLMRFNRQDFDEIIAMDVPGPNKNKSKAARLRSFKVPARFCEALSSETDNRTVNIFAALVLDDWVWAVVDFARLVQMHVVSIGRHFVEEDLQPGSAIWPRLWAGFQAGPDWLIEYPLVLNELDLWRQEVRARRLHTPLVDALCDPSLLPFNAFGRHTANDAAHGMGVFPNTPISAFVDDDLVFKQFTHSLKSYLAQFDNPEYLNAMVSLPSSSNPFAFNHVPHKKYVDRYIHVFRRSDVWVSAPLYNHLLVYGLLDKDHVIGQPYPPVAHEERATNFKKLDVVYYHKPYDAYTVIQAKVPDDWVHLALGGYQPVRGPIRDIRTSGYQTAIGISDFRENKLNMRDTKRSVAALCVPGRKGKDKTGVGRPTRTPTVGTLRRELSQIERITEKSRVSSPDDPGSDSEDDDYDNEDEIELENASYIPKEENKIITQFADLQTAAQLFDGDNQAQPIAKSARTAHRFSATSVASADAVMAPSRRSARSAAAGGSEKRSASPLPFDCEIQTRQKRSKPL